VDNTNSNGDEIRIRSDNVCNEPIEPEVDISRLVETLDCE
jgi:hypothetical protein